jgi:hypothetical protein
MAEDELPNAASIGCSDHPKTIAKRDERCQVAGVRGATDQHGGDLGLSKVGRSLLDVVERRIRQETTYICAADIQSYGNLTLRHAREF